MSSEEEKSKETYPCFIKVSDDEYHDSFIELPTEKNGSILLSTIQGQFPNAIGLKYKSASGGWRGVRLSDNALDPPYEGWGNSTFYITLPKTDSAKRKMEESPNREPEAKLVKTGTDSADLLSDLIVLGLPYKATEDDLKNYFQQFGELAMHEIKLDSHTKESRGFGFVRFKSASSAEKALNANHSILGRRCELRLPKRKEEMPMKLFVGRLPEGTTKTDLLKYFEDYGDITDTYIPSPFRGFGFVTFASSECGRDVLRKTHIYKGNRLNVTYAEPKSDQKGGGDRAGWNNNRDMNRGGRTQYSQGQDPPFNFDAMRQMVSRSNYNQGAYNQLYNAPTTNRPSNDNSQQNYNYGSSGGYNTEQKPPSSYGNYGTNNVYKNSAYQAGYDAATVGNIAAVAAALYGNSGQMQQNSSSDQQNIPYGFWGNTSSSK